MNVQVLGIFREAVQHVGRFQVFRAQVVTRVLGVDLRGRCGEIVEKGG